MIKTVKKVMSRFRNSTDMFYFAATKRNVKNVSLQVQIFLYSLEQSVENHRGYVPEEKILVFKTRSYWEIAPSFTSGRYTSELTVHGAHDRLLFAVCRDNSMVCYLAVIVSLSSQ
jgi:hypothetical protein